MREVVRIGAYLPRGSANGVAVAALDEDEFTLAAAATERAWTGRREEPGPVAVHLLGEFPPVADWGFSSLLGRECGVTRHPGTADELARVLAELERESGGPAFVIASELSDRVPKRVGKASGHGSAAVAFLLEPAEEASAFPIPKGASARSALATSLRLGGASKELPRSVTMVGDWDRDPAAGRRNPTVASRESLEKTLAAVSEGAYVPRARYLENLPSRWRFLAESCTACGGTTFPARQLCRHCGRRDALAPVTLPFDGGRVVAVTTVGKGGQPTEFDAQVEALGAYDVALVELARGMRVTLQVTDSAPGELEVGDRVDTLLRRLYPMEGEWRYGRKAVPAPSASAAGGPAPD